MAALFIAIALPWTALCAEPEQAGQMDMGSMQGGSAPADARDPAAYSDGLEYIGMAGMAGMEATDRLAFGTLLIDELEYVSGNGGTGIGWTAQGSYGNDDDKLWMRTQGLRLDDEVDPASSAELLWWSPSSAFWGTVLGVRQDLGYGAHTYVAGGVEGLAPYGFDVQFTAYLGEDGRWSGRFRGSYDLLFTNRLILVSGLEANAHSRADDRRNVGAGLANLELGLRIRYEIHRKFAPYAGYVVERAFADSASRRAAAGDAVTERRFVAGVRAWW